MRARAKHTVVGAVVVMLAGGCGGASPSALPMPPGARAIAVAPDFAGTIWAPTSRGDFRSQDGGHSWQRIHAPAFGQAVAFTERFAYVAGQPGAQIGDFGGRQLSAARPTPARFVSVASPYHRTNRLYALDERGALWLSVRAGRGWYRLRATGLPAGAVAVSAVRNLVTQPDVVYVAAGTEGLWRSTDFGASFQRIAGVRSAYSVGLTTDDQRLVLVAAADGIYRSTDGARSFARVSRVRADAVAYDPRNSLLAYAVVGGALLRSDDGGARWSE
jgi:photosystem II stability/assembly factor-like uncharacterized protein